ncbi:hypothetical protein JQR85_05520 [Stutzerimonas urumqiensis]|uniref:hypothetical protein n=1 Tax=Stutzerimonas urumqiensis TaxID=638269 RepID=UPI003DA5F37F
MKFAGLGLAAVMAVGLTGCVITPKDVDAEPVFSEFTVDEPISDLYYRLTSNQSENEFCNQIHKPMFYPDRGQFRIYYGSTQFGMNGVSPLMLASIHGQAVGDKTKLVMREANIVKEGTVAEVLTNFIKTGVCE